MVTHSYCMHWNALKTIRMTFFTERVKTVISPKKLWCSCGLKVFFVWHLKMQFSFFVQLLCNSRNAQLIFPSCLTLRGLELEVSQLKNVEAEEENELSLWERVKSVVLEGKKKMFKKKKILPAYGQSYFKQLYAFVDRNKTSSLF